MRFAKVPLLLMTAALLFTSEAVAADRLVIGEVWTNTR